MKKELVMVAKRGLAIVNENSPTILTGLAVVGVIGAVVLAIKQTPKAIKIWEEKDKKLKEKEEIKATSTEEEYSEKKYKKDKLIIKLETMIELTKVYAPVGLLMVGSIASMIGANQINLKRLATVTSLYSASQETLKKWQEKTFETVGKTKEAEIHGKVCDDILEKHPLDRNFIMHTGHGETLCYDPMTDRYFKSDIEFIRKTMNDFNFALRSDMAMSLNEFYEMLNLGTAKLSEDVGWTANHPMELRFDSRLASDGTPCLVLDYVVEPIYQYRDW